MINNWYNNFSISSKQDQNLKKRKIISNSFCILFPLSTEIKTLHMGGRKKKGKCHSEIEVMRASPKFLCPVGSDCGRRMSQVDRVEGSLNTSKHLHTHAATHSQPNRQIPVGYPPHYFFPNTINRWKMRTDGFYGHFKIFNTIKYSRLWHFGNHLRLATPLPASGLMMLGTEFL